MGNYRNEVENTADYLGHRIPMFNELMDVKGVPEYVDIPTHLRMMYGHTDWKDHVVRLTPEMMTQLREKKDRIDVGRKVLPRMYAGMTVAILNNETMGPVSYNEMMSDGCWLELLDLDEAIDRAAFWFTEDILEPDGDFHLFTCYFLLAFRLALMEDEMDEEKRFEKERADIYQFANEDLVKGLLEVIDNFERALEASKDDDSKFKEGMEMIFKQLMGALEKAGVSEIKALGEEFDPNFHNAVMMEETDEFESNKVSGVMQKGYTLNSRVIRPSMVKVAQ